jgi:hypothetical protein
MIPVPPRLEPILISFKSIVETLVVFRFLDRERAPQRDGITTSAPYLLAWTPAPSPEREV